MIVLRRLCFGLLCWLSLGLPVWAADFEELVRGLGQGSFDQREKAIGELAATGNPRAAAILEALQAGELSLRADGAIFIVNKAGAASDPLTGKVDTSVEVGSLERVRINNRLRRAIEASMGSLTLMSNDPMARRDAAVALFKNRDAAVLPTLEQAMVAEKDSAILNLMRQAQAAILLSGSDASSEVKLAAIDVLVMRGDRDAQALLSGIATQDTGQVGLAARNAAAVIEQKLQVWEAGQNIWYGLSLGSVLLLAAIGLAITFGVMGIINMAHGEMVMLGAYTAYMTQDVLRSLMPSLAPHALLISLPLAFLVVGVIGVLIERGIIRFLYGRPLETLLATWGLSLILQQGVRSIFGPTNREIGAPTWMAGAFDLGHLTITFNRLWIIIFAIAVFAVLTFVLRRTNFGLHMRAVTQNRSMASTLGIRTPWVDALTFGLGSGVAGIAGVALSQIDNVSPNLGQGYIIDSFMVVVFGGVGNLWGTVVGAMALGIVNKFLEPYAGAVLGKIFVLAFIILFIQKRPRGLFALKGRSVEA